MVEYLKDAVSIIGGAIGLATFLFATWQYRQAQIWKRAEFVANEMKTFRSDSKNSIALTILDWDSRRIKFEDNKDDQVYVVDNNILHEALRFYTLSEYSERKKITFPPPQNYIRDVFDHLFDDLERLNSFVRAGLVKADDLRPYLEYWLDIMSGKNYRKPEDIIKQLWGYIDAYNYRGVRELFLKLGYKIPQKTPVGTIQRESSERA